MKRIATAVVRPTGPNYTQSIETGGFTIQSDEPRGAGGQNAGATPYGLLLAALGACTAITLKMYADPQRLEHRGARSLADALAGRGRADLH